MVGVHGRGRGEEKLEEVAVLDRWRLWVCRLRVCGWRAWEGQR